MTLIQCLLGAASPILSSHTYMFERDKHGRFVCEVLDLVHVQCLLSREDVYREVKPIVDEPVREHIETLLGSSILPSMVLIAEGLEVQLGAIVARAHQESGLTIADWNKLPEANREQRLADTVAAWKAEATPPAPEPEPESEAEAQAPEASVLDSVEPEVEEADEGDEADDGDGDGPEASVLDAVVTGVVTETVVKPAKTGRRGRRGR